jgi:hypothetical protein
MSRPDRVIRPTFVPHQEINANPHAPLSCVVVRNGPEAVVVNLDLPAVEPNPEQVPWVDDIHRVPELAPDALVSASGSSSHLARERSSREASAWKRRRPAPAWDDDQESGSRLLLLDETGRLRRTA